MPRQLRVHVPGGFYHVTLRGNHREPIFREESDRELLCNLTGEVLLRYDARVHAFCWMSNHIHLLTQVSDVPLGRLIQTLASRYARLFQRNLPTTGHLFERRYHAVVVVADDQLLQTIRYIHLNPVTARIASDPGAYRWSSHAAYRGAGGPPWLTTNRVLAVFDDDLSRARIAYDNFIRDGVDPAQPSVDEEDREALRESIPVDAVSNGLYARRSWTSLDELIAVTCDEAGLVPDVLTAPRGDREATELRATISAEAVRAGLATLGQLGTYFGCSAAAVSKLLQRRVRREQRN